jgi:3-(3-hydroxy-phenyl)propionate hydroxylase
MSADAPVLVVGAGPTGSTVALALAARGVRSVVVERWAEVYPQPRAVHLDDEVYRVLARLGLADDLARLTRPTRGLRLVDAGLRTLAQLDRDGVSPATGHPRANLFDQPVLDAVLRERLRTTPEVTLLAGREVTKVSQTAPGTVELHHRDPAGGDEQSLEARFVLGCDGANSLVRTAVGARYEDLGFEQRWLVLDVETTMELGHWDGVHQVCSSTRAATYMRVGATRHRWEVRLHDDEDASDLTDLASVVPLLDPWFRGVDLSRLTLVRSTGYTFRAAVADRWRAGGLFLLGDAAHLTPPFIGQGMGAGVRDADNLAWKLAGVLDGSLPSDVLDTFETERSAHARAMIGLARAVGVTMTQGSLAGDAARRALLPLVPRVPGLRALAVDSATPPLVATPWVHRRRGDRLAGRLCPQVVHGEAVLDAEVGPGWSFVTAVPLAPSSVEELAARGVVVVEAGVRPELAAWLRLGRTRAALVRPDRTVLASGDDVVALVATTAALVAPPSREVLA